MAETIDSTSLSVSQNYNLKTIPLTRGKVAIVDEDDYEWLKYYNWSFHASNKNDGQGYAARTKKVNGKGIAIWMHREINQTPDGFETDHINRNRLDNRKINLRTVTSSQNRVNRYYNNQTGFRGVQKEYNKWVARIKINGILKRIGSFSSPVKAAQRYNEYAYSLYGQKAILNDVDPKFLSNP